MIAPRGAAPEPIQGGLIEALALLPEQFPHLERFAFPTPFHEELISGPQGGRPLKGGLKAPTAQGEGTLAAFLEQKGGDPLLPGPGEGAAEGRFVGGGGALGRRKGQARTVYHSKASLPWAGPGVTPGLSAKGAPA
jgi:hypothetical protein